MTPASPPQHGAATADSVGSLCVLGTALALCPEGLEVAAARRLCEREGASFDELNQQLRDAGTIEQIGRTLKLCDDTAAANIASTLPAEEQVRLHLQLAESLADTALDVVAAAFQRALHLRAAGAADRALQLLLQAAELHEVNGDFQDAFDCYEGILVDVDDAATRLLVLDRRAQAAGNAGSDRVADCWLDAATACEQAGDHDARARALYHLYWSSREEDPTRWLVAARELGCGELGWPTRAAALLQILDTKYRDAADLDLLALRLAREQGDRLLEALSLLGIGVSHAVLGDIDAASRALRQSVSISISRRDHRATVTARINLVMCLVDDLRTAEALVEADNLVVYVAQHRLDDWRAEACVQRAAVLTQLGRLTEAQQATTTAFAQVRGLDDQVTAAFTSTMHARVMLETGSRYDFAAALELGETCASTFGVHALAQEARFVRARLQAIDGDLDGALATAAGLDMQEDLPLTAMVAVWMARLAATHGRVDIALRAERLCGSLEGVTARVVSQAVREVAATAVALGRGDAQALLEVVQEWRARDRMLDANRALISAGCVQFARGERSAAAETFMLAHRELVGGGSLADLELVSARLRDLAGDDDSAPRHVHETQLFAGLAERQRADAEALIATARFEAGKVFYSPDDEHGTVYFLRAGRVRLYCMTDEGKRLTVEILDPGAVFGESAVLGRPTAGLYAEADESVVAGVMPAEQMRELIRRAPRVGLNLLELVGDRLHRSHQLTEQVAFWTVNQRITRLLLDLDERYGHPTLAGERLINKVFTHSDIAEMVNARRETVGEFLKTLRAQGLLELRKRRLVLCDVESLRALLD